ncbi:hypothetical protein IK3_00374 [Bacillus toyonensis]|uniref:hypothetical protein n=2 Tax=Bacillus TaxID=1386 RepID=UPI000279D7C9|nr:hypothetical protein [Bacillus toyonensis]EJR68942.1 hypothetical protein IK3_00374 [Bacillus toyonensis]QWI34691.1 hypothetical protein EXW25_26480 [Bacillus toyonensis]
MRARQPMNAVEGFVYIDKPNYKNNRVIAFLGEMWAYNAPRITINEPLVENAPNNYGAFLIGATDTTVANATMFDGQEVTLENFTAAGM